MSNLFNDNKTKYVIDTSTFIQIFKMYPQDIFRNLWLKFEEYLATEIIISHEEVYNELSEKSDELSKWSKLRKSSFYRHAFEAETEFITQIGIKYPNFIIKPKKYYADPWIIAQAKVKKLKIITEERINRNSERIPKIAKEMFEVECVSLIDLMKKESWTF